MIVARGAPLMRFSNPAPNPDMKNMIRAQGAIHRSQSGSGSAQVTIGTAIQEDRFLAEEK
jgi:hypothetical protein